jgi:hypothetical protein
MDLTTIRDFIGGLIVGVALWVGLRALSRKLRRKRDEGSAGGGEDV